MTREPTGHPEADGARGPSRPPRPRPPRANTGPFPRDATGPLPRAATGPIPRVPADPDPGGRDPWSDTAPGFEFEGRRSRPGRGPKRPQPRPARPAGPTNVGPGPTRPPGELGPAAARTRRRVSGTPRRLASRCPSRRRPGPMTISSPCPASSSMTRCRAPAGVIPLAREPSPHQTGPRPAGGPRRRPPGPRPDLRSAGAEWAGLLRSLLPQPAKRRWSKEFRAGLDFRGWGVRVAIPILAMVVFGVAVVVIAGANSGNSGAAPPATALGFPPATLAGNDFTAAASGRGIKATLGRVASVGAEIVAVGSQTGARIPRAQFSCRATTDVPGRWGRSARQAAGCHHRATAPSSWPAARARGSRSAPARSGPARTAGPGRWHPAPACRCSPATRSTAWRGRRPASSPIGANVPGGDQARSTPLIFTLGQRDQLATARRGATEPGRGRRPRAGRQVRRGGREADPDRGGRRHHRGHRQAQADGDGPGWRGLAEQRRRLDLGGAAAAGRARSRRWPGWQPSATGSSCCGRPP